MSSNENLLFLRAGALRDILVRRHRQHAAPQLFEIGWLDRDPVDGSQHLKDTLPKSEECFIVPRQSDHVGIQDQLIEPFAKYLPVDSSETHRLRGDAARTAHDARASPRRRRPSGGAPAGGTASRRPARPVRDRAVGGDRRPRGHRRPAGRVAAGAGRDRRPHLGALRARPPARAAPRDVRARVGRVVADPDGEGRRARSRHCARPRTRSTRSRSTCARARSSGEASSTCTGSSSSACSSSATNGRTSRSSPSVSTRRARTTNPRRSGAWPRATSSCATSAGPCTATAPISRGCSTPASRRPRCATPTRCSSRRKKPACAPRLSAPRARGSTRRRARVIAAAGLGEFFVHRVGHGIGAGGARRSLSGRRQRSPACRRPRVQRRARDIPGGPVRHATRRHRGRDRCTGRSV